jgi:hypothetical protein
VQVLLPRDLYLSKVNPRTFGLEAHMPLAIFLAPNFANAVLFVSLLIVALIIFYSFLVIDTINNTHLFFVNNFFEKNDKISLFISYNNKRLNLSKEKMYFVQQKKRLIIGAAQIR